MVDENSGLRQRLLNFIDPPGSALTQVANAGIIAGYTFFSTLAGLGATGLLTDVTTSLVAAGIAAGLSFFGSLITQRALKKE